MFQKRFCVALLAYLKTSVLQPSEIYAEEPFDLPWVFDFELIV